MKKKIDGESFLRSPAAERKKIGRIAKRLRRRHRGLSPQDGGREGVAIMTTAVGQRRCKTTTTHDRRDCAAEARHFTNGGKIPGSLQTQSRRRRYMRQPSARRRDPIYPDKPPPPPHILSFFLCALHFSFSLASVLFPAVSLLMLRLLGPGYQRVHS